MVEFDIEFEKQNFPDPPLARIYIKQPSDEEGGEKQYVMDEGLDLVGIGTYIDLMIANLKRLKKQAKKQITASRKGFAF